jgi:hypothetical protein
MADDPSAAGLEYLIPVMFDPVLHTLTIQHPNLLIRPGDRVLWNFIGIPTGWAPWIQFKPDGGPRAFLGPFSSLSQIENGLWGMAAAGIPASAYTYRATIQKGLGLDWQTGTSLLCSSQGTIAVHSEPVLDPAHFRISPLEGEVDKLKVEPLTQNLKSGQSAIWTFEGFTGDPALWEQWRPRIDFGRYEGEGEVELRPLGPFTCLQFEEGKVTGLGNTGVVGNFHFEVSLVSVTSGEIRWVNSGDPAIDNQGPIWDPVSGGPYG